MISGQITRGKYPGMVVLAGALTVGETLDKWDSVG